MDSLPDDILYGIYSHLPDHDIANITTINKRFRLGLLGYNRMKKFYHYEDIDEHYISIRNIVIDIGITDHAAVVEKLNTIMYPMHIKYCVMLTFTVDNDGGGIYTLDDRYDPLIHLAERHFLEIVFSPEHEYSDVLLLSFMNIMYIIHDPTKLDGLIERADMLYIKDLGVNYQLFIQSLFKNNMKPIEELQPNLSVIINKIDKSAIFGEDVFISGSNNSKIIYHSLIVNNNIKASQFIPCKNIEYTTACYGQQVEEFMDDIAALNTSINRIIIADGINNPDYVFDCTKFENLQILDLYNLSQRYHILSNERLIDLHVCSSANDYTISHIPNNIEKVNIDKNMMQLLPVIGPCDVFINKNTGHNHIIYNRSLSQLTINVEKYNPELVEFIETCISLINSPIISCTFVDYTVYDKIALLSYISANGKCPSITTRLLENDDALHNMLLALGTLIKN